MCFEKVDLKRLCDRLHNFSQDSQRRTNTVILVSDGGLISVLGPTDLIAALNTSPQRVVHTYSIDIKGKCTVLV